jgi:hypothetical protein
VHFPTTNSGVTSARWPTRGSLRHKQRQFAEAKAFDYPQNVIGCRSTVGFLAIAAGLAIQAPEALAQPPAATLKLGETQIYASGRLRPGQTLACVGHGKRITAAVPAPVSSSGYPGATGTKHLAVSLKLSWVRGLRLQISSSPHGSYLVTCS